MTVTISVRELAKMIGHSLLHPTMTDADLEAGCRLAARYDVAAACVKPYAVRQGCDLLAGTDVKVCAVVAFPHGNSRSSIKVAETRAAVADGAAEIDMVVNIGKELGGDWANVADELTVVNAAAIEGGAVLKVIFENDYLQYAQIARLCQICSEAGAAFVKTSTGYGFVKQPDGSHNYRGASDAHPRLMRASSPPPMQIKAAGGVRTPDDLLRVRGLGVSRIGATATAAILDEVWAHGYH